VELEAARNALAVFDKCEDLETEMHKVKQQLKDCQDSIFGIRQEYEDKIMVLEIQIESFKSELQNYERDKVKPLLREL
jgi:septation ring formation regulator EzrA